MPSTRPSIGYHILALVTIAVWGTTFVSTKVLLSHGLTPPEIMFYRFIIAYALTWIFTRKVWADTWKDEVGYVSDVYAVECSRSRYAFVYREKELAPAEASEPEGE